MEERFKSLSVFEFQAMFPDDASCEDHLAGIKWATGYACKKCGNGVYCKGMSHGDRQCTRCGHGESPTSGTLFHRCKFSLLKAFYIVYYMSTSKKGISSTELSRKLALRQKTCWLFRHKVIKAMESSRNFPMAGKVEVDETFVGGQDEDVTGRQPGKKKLVAIAIEKQGKGISRMYARVIPEASYEHLSEFMGDHIDSKAQVRTDKWAAYSSLAKFFPNLLQEESGKKGQNFPHLHRAIMLFKAWLRGMHHSVHHLQAYIDEYTWRFNRQKMKEGIFDNLLIRMMTSKPCTYKMIIG